MTTEIFWENIKSLPFNEQVRSVVRAATLNRDLWPKLAESEGYKKWVSSSYNELRKVDFPEIHREIREENFNIETAECTHDQHHGSITIRSNVKPFDVYQSEIAIPEGHRAVAFREPKAGETYLSLKQSAEVADIDLRLPYLILKVAQ